ncbi:MAG: hypothetical protein ACRDK4_04030 [Solirubrobacteraceae bacterium]
MPRKRKPTKKRLQRVSVRAEKREQVDWDKFAWALIQHVRLQQQANRPGQNRK